jgi:membrane associated rhomboid family serine protease
MYNSLGASGAVSAALFASILFMPLSKIYLMFIPIGIPAFVFGPLYLAYCAYMAKKGTDNIGHDAHFYGAIFGFIFPILFKPELISLFFSQILNFQF